MNDQTATLIELGDLLYSHREELAAAWMERLLIDAPEIRVSLLPQNELKLDMLLWVDALTTNIHLDLDTNDPWPWPGRLDLDKWVSGYYDIADITSVLMLFKEIALPVLWRSHPEIPDSKRMEFTFYLDQHLWKRARFFIESYAIGVTSRLEKQKSHLAIMLEAARAAGGTLHLDEVLKIAGKGIAAAAGVQGCTFFLVNEDGSHGSRRMCGNTGDDGALDVMQQHCGQCQGLDGALETIINRVQDDLKPLTSTELRSDPRFIKVEMIPEVKSFLVLPCVYKEHLVAIAIACALGEAHNFAPEEIELVWGIANVAAPAIANARTHQRAQSLAVREERVRLAHEMHDRLAQILGALSLKANVTADVLADGDIEEVMTNLYDMTRVADDALAQLREEIFGLRAYDVQASKLLPALREYIKNYRLYFDLNVYLRVDDESVVNLSDNASIQVFRIIQEALTNVRKHAGTRDAWVSIVEDRNGVRIEIRDDGVGFNLADVVKDQGLHYGLEIMRERAESVGGRLTLHTQPGEATRVEIWIPTQE